MLLLSIIFNLFFLQKVLNQNDPKIEYAISHNYGDPAKNLLEVINNTTNKLDIAIYNIDHQDIITAIMKAKQRNVKIRLIVDNDNAQNKDSKKLLAKLHAANIPIKINEEKKMHLKLTISDTKTIVVGSFNYTEESANENIEVLINFENKPLSEELSDIFDQLWNDSSYSYWQP